MGQSPCETSSAPQRKSESSAHHSDSPPFANSSFRVLIERRRRSGHPFGYISRGNFPILSNYRDGQQLDSVDSNFRSITLQKEKPKLKLCFDKGGNACLQGNPLRRLLITFVVITMVLTHLPEVLAAPLSTQTPVPCPAQDKQSSPPAAPPPPPCALWRRPGAAAPAPGAAEVAFLSLLLVW